MNEFRDVPSSTLGLVGSISVAVRPTYLSKRLAERDKTCDLLCIIIAPVTEIVGERTMFIIGTVCTSLAFLGLSFR